MATHADADDVGEGYDVSHHSEVVMTEHLLDQLQQRGSVLWFRWVLVTKEQI